MSPQRTHLSVQRRPNCEFRPELGEATSMGQRLEPLRNSLLWKRSELAGESMGGGTKSTRIMLGCWIRPGEVTWPISNKDSPIEGGRGVFYEPVRSWTLQEPWHARVLANLDALRPPQRNTPLQGMVTVHAPHMYTTTLRTTKT